MPASAKNPHGSEELERLLLRLLPEAVAAPTAFSSWYNSTFKMNLEIVGQEVLDVVLERLGQEGARIAEAEGRLAIWFPFLGGEKLVKSAASVRTKVGRTLRESAPGGAPGNPRLSEARLGEIVLGFPDLARFRIVADLPTDVERGLDLILDRERRILLGRYRLVSRLKDYVYDLRLREPAKGHRARQFGVEVWAGGVAYRVEVQLMTRLQHVWDQRNHPIYEHVRKGGKLSDRLLLHDVGLAEALHLIDMQAARNWQDFLAERAAQKPKWSGRRRGGR
jgi:hypothetical protein